MNFKDHGESLISKKRDKRFLSDQAITDFLLMNPMSLLLVIKRKLLLAQNGR